MQDIIDHLEQAKAALANSERLPSPVRWAVQQSGPHVFTAGGDLDSRQNVIDHLEQAKSALAKSKRLPSPDWWAVRRLLKDIKCELARVNSGLQYSTVN